MILAIRKKLEKKKREKIAAERQSGPPEATHFASERGEK